jgi:hypothetical protein
VQDLAYPENPQDAPDPPRNGLSVIAERKDARAGQVHGSPSMDEPTPAGGDDVLDPVDVASVGESDQEAVPEREHVDGGSVSTSADTAPVQDDAEVPKPLGHGPNGGVGHATIESGQPSGKGHRPRVDGDGSIGRGDPDVLVLSVGCGEGEQKGPFLGNRGGVLLG